MGRLRVLLFETPNDPYYNLALEESLFLLHSMNVIRDDVLRIWRNANAVVIGYFQRADEEVDMEHAGKYGISVVRRFTGGGAVYHDLGNINYAVITGRHGGSIEDLYGHLLKGILGALRYLGLSAYVENINDIAIGGRKVSGTAASFRGNTWFLHGSLLVSTDLERLSSVLKISRKKLMDKHVSSVKYRVATLNDLAGRRYEYWEVIEALVKGYSELLGDEPVYDMPGNLELLVAGKLYRGKYLRDDWNLGRASSMKYRKVYDEIAETIKTVTS